MPATSFAVGQVKRSGVWDGSGGGVRVANGVAAVGTCSGDATVTRFVAPGSRKVDFIVKGVCSALEATARHSEKVGLIFKAVSSFFCSTLRVSVDSNGQAIFQIWCPLPREF